jgi:hypothetical protein
MKEEHPREYQRLVESGQLESRIAPPASAATYMWAMVFGFASLAAGVFLIVLVLYAAIRG